MNYAKEQHNEVYGYVGHKPYTSKALQTFSPQLTLITLMLR